MWFVLHEWEYGGMDYIERINKMVKTMTELIRVEMLHTVRVVREQSPPRKLPWL